MGRENCCFIHVCLVPYITGSNEYKSKPTQHSVNELQGIGITPDVIVLRSDGPVGEEIKRKIARFCNVDADCVVSDITLKCLYDTPVALHKEGLDKAVARKLKLGGRIDLKEWRAFLKSVKSAKKTVDIALVGKYVTLHDAYLSVAEALNAGGYACGARVNIRWVDSETVTAQTAPVIFAGVGGIIIPGGFGNRATEGMMQSCRYARENDIPCLGICLGMQMMAIEFARDVCGLKGATSGEFEPQSDCKIIDLMNNQKNIENMGGTMRLGAYDCVLKPGSAVYAMYSRPQIAERHRHRYEFNNAYREIFEQNGMSLCGQSPDGKLVEIMELPGKSFYVGCQFHPEFKSRPDEAHPLFAEFVKKSVQHSMETNK